MTQQRHLESYRFRSGPIHNSKHRRVLVCFYQFKSLNLDSAQENLLARRPRREIRI